MVSEAPISTLSCLVHSSLQSFAWHCMCPCSFSQQSSHKCRVATHTEDDAKPHRHNLHRDPGTALTETVGFAVGRVAQVVMRSKTQNL